MITELKSIQELFSNAQYHEIIELLPNSKELDDEFLLLKAHSLFELGKFDQARFIYKKLQMFANVGFCFLLENDFVNAEKNYLKAKNSSAKKWGLFMVLLLSRCTETFPGPGFLTFRLFFESSYFYFVKFKKKEFLARIFETKNQLQTLYPDLDKEIKKIDSLV